MKAAMDTSKRKDIAIEIASKMISLYTGVTDIDSDVLPTFRYIGLEFAGHTHSFSSLADT